MYKNSWRIQTSRAGAIHSMVQHETSYHSASGNLETYCAILALIKGLVAAHLDVLTLLLYCLAQT